MVGTLGCYENLSAAKEIPLLDLALTLKECHRFFFRNLLTSFLADFCRIFVGRFFASWSRCNIASENWPRAFFCLHSCYFCAIRIQRCGSANSTLVSIRIRHFRPNVDPDPCIWWQKREKLSLKKRSLSLAKNCTMFITRPPEGRPSYRPAIKHI